MQDVRAGVTYLDIVLGNAVGFDLVHAVENPDSVGVMHHQVAYRDIRQGAYFLAGLLLYSALLPAGVDRGVSEYNKLDVAVLDTSAESSRNHYDPAGKWLFGIGGEVGLESLVLEVAGKGVRALFSAGIDHAGESHNEVALQFRAKNRKFAAPGGGLNRPLDVKQESQLHVTAADKRVKIHACVLVQLGVQLRLGEHESVQTATDVLFLGLYFQILGVLHCQRAVILPDGRIFADENRFSIVEYSCFLIIAQWEETIGGAERYPTPEFLADCRELLAHFRRVLSTELLAESFDFFTQFLR